MEDKLSPVAVAADESGGWTGKTKRECDRQMRHSSNEQDETKR